MFTSWLKVTLEAYCSIYIICISEFICYTKYCMSIFWCQNDIVIPSTFSFSFMVSAIVKENGNVLGPTQIDIRNSVNGISNARFT